MHIRKGVIAALLIGASAGATAGQPPAPAEAVPVEPVSAILEAFRSHSVVALGESHGSVQVHDFRMRLIRDPRFTSVVDDIVVESGNARHQEVIDRFTSGEEVMDEILRRVWLDAADAFHQPMYEEFFRAIRAVNLSRAPRERRVRVVLGEAPDHRDRDIYAAAVVQREVIARRHRALVTYGNLHVIRQHAIDPNPARQFRTLVNLLEADGTPVFAIWAHTGTDLATLQPNIGAWPVPSLSLVRDTILGRTEYAFYSPFGGWRLREGKPIIENGAPLYDPPRAGLTMEEQVDAVLYLGPEREMRFSFR